MKRAISKQSGFSLVEIVVATAVISMMIIALTNLVIAIAAIQRQNDHLALANRTAEAKIESLRNNHYNSLANGQLDFTSELSAELPDPRSATVDVSEPNPGIKRLDVTITYQEGSKAKSVKLSALVGSIGISQ